MKSGTSRIIAILLIIALFATSLSACGSSESTPAPTTTSDSNAGTTTPIEPIMEEDPVVEGLTVEQKASMAMLNYLAYEVQVINDSRRSRVALEEVFDELVNDVEKSSIDEETLNAYHNIFDTIKSYRMNTFAFERLAFLSGQKDALAILAYVPNPLEVMESLATRGPWLTLANVAFSTISTAAGDSYTSAEELAYLESKWALEDSEEVTLMNSRTDMFDYMVRIAQGLPKGITLTENDIEDFVEKTTKNSGKSKLDWLKNNQDKYQYFGYYWLELADSYYENGYYNECLAAIETYRANDTGLFKLDKRLAESMVYAAIAAGEVLEGEEYESIASNYIDIIVQNTESNDWTLRYYAAMAYAGLFERTNNRAYLEKAYETAKDNVRSLAPEQRKQNTAYIEEIKELKADNNADKEEVSLIKEYNKFLKNARKSELLPVYEPLLRNCELLFAIAEELDISDDEKAVIDSILHDDPVFLSYELDRKYSYGKTSSISEISKDSMSYSGILADQTFTLPAVLAPTGTTIKGEVVASGQTITLENWTVDEVDRNKSTDINDFEAVYSCKAPKTIVYKVGDTITLWITPPGASTEEDVVTVKIVVDKLTVGVPHFKVESAE